MLSSDRVIGVNCTDVVELEHMIFMDGESDLGGGLRMVICII